MSLGLGLGLVAGLCGAVRAASTKFDVIYTWHRFKVLSPREMLLQDIAVTMSCHAGLGYGNDNL